MHTLLLLADAIFLVHALLAAFIVLGLLAIWIGCGLGWALVRNPWLRLAHLAAMALVTAESLLGIFCPLTRRENLLRQAAGTPGRYTSSFVAFWAEHIFYWDLPEETFSALYLLLLAAIAATWWLAPPRAWRPEGKEGPGGG